MEPDKKTKSHLTNRTRAIGKLVTPVLQHITTKLTTAKVTLMLTEKLLSTYSSQKMLSIPDLNI